MLCKYEHYNYCDVKNLQCVRNPSLSIGIQLVTRDFVVKLDKFGEI